MGSAEKVCQECGLEGSVNLGVPEQCTNCGNRSWYGPYSREGVALHRKMAPVHKERLAKEAQEAAAASIKLQFVSISEDLERLGRLRASGDLSDAEFSALKARLISGHGISDPKGPPEEDPSTDLHDSLRDEGAVDRTPSSMGVEACDDCGGPVEDSAETCPSCGSHANHLRRLRPLQQEEAKKKEALENKQRLEQHRVVRAGLVGLVVSIALAGGCVALISGVSGGSGGSSLLDDCVSRMKGYDREIARLSCKLSLSEKYGD